MLKLLIFGVNIHPQCRNCCQLHQQSDQEETSGAVSTGEAHQHLQVPACYTYNSDLCIHTNILMHHLWGTEMYLLHVKRTGTGYVQMEMKKRENRFNTRHFRGKPGEKAEANWAYPNGSFFFQLASTASAWVRIGGSPKRCDTSQYGTARLRGSVLEEIHSCKWYIAEQPTAGREGMSR